MPIFLVNYYRLNIGVFTLNRNVICIDQSLENIDFCQCSTICVEYTKIKISFQNLITGSHRTRSEN